MKPIRLEPRTNLSEKYYEEPVEVTEILFIKKMMLKDVDGTLRWRKKNKIVDIIASS